MQYKTEEDVPDKKLHNNYTIGTFYKERKNVNLCKDLVRNCKGKRLLAKATFDGRIVLKQISKNQTEEK